ncbi:hypothetical protein D3C76_1676370 [compost metagenome]
MMHFLTARTFPSPFDPAACCDPRSCTDRESCDIFYRLIGVGYVDKPLSFSPDDNVATGIDGSLRYTSIG